MSARSLLLKDPFGPYKDADVLSPLFYSKNKYAPLHTVRLYKRDAAGNYNDTGLTKTEFISSAVDGVYFTGVLDVEAKHVCKWLSIQGLAIVQGDLERRAVSNGKQPFRLENLDDPVFGSELIVKVLILCKKTLTATFLTNIDRPDSFILASKHGDGHHNFLVTSMHSGTYHLSRRYMERYRLVRLLNDISHKISVPLGERTVEWFLAAIRERNAKPTKQRRIIFNQEDPDLDPDGIVLVRRNPRYVSAAEVKGILAKEAPWLLAQQLLQPAKNRQLNVTSLLNFSLAKTKVTSRSRQSNQRVLIKKADLIGRCVKYGISSRDEWATLMKRAKARDVKSLLPAEEEPEDAVPLIVHVPGQGNLDSDSDATVQSSSEAEGSDAPVEVGPREILAHPPPRPPQIGSRWWFCHMCIHRIDIMKLAERSKSQTIAVAPYNKSLYRAWSRTVASHYQTQHPR